MSDHYLKARAAGYFNGLLTGSDDDFKKLLRKYAICPPSRVEGNMGVNVGTVKTQGLGPNRPFLQGTTRGEEVRLAEMDNNHLVAHIDLRLMARGTFVATGNEGGDRIYFDASYTAAATHVPVYFLPWDDKGASVRMTIPVKGYHAVDPDIFFTAAINGCSVFFQGTPQRPTIYHCGGGTGYQKSEIAEAIGFWQDVVDEFVAQDATALRANLGQVNARSVDKAEYVATPGVKAKADVKVAGTKIKSYTTKTALSYQHLLKAKHGLTSITIEDVNPWACVLGRRATNGDWSFFLQENATILYHQVTRTLPNLFKSTKSASQMVARPLRWRQIFPSDRKHHSVQAPIPKIH